MSILTTWLASVTKIFVAHMFFHSYSKLEIATQSIKIVIEEITPVRQITEMLTVFFGVYLFITVSFTMVWKAKTKEDRRSKKSVGRALFTFMKVCRILEYLYFPRWPHIAHRYFDFLPLDTIPLDLTLEDERELANLGLVSLGAFQGKIGRLDCYPVADITFFS